MTNYTPEALEALSKAAASGTLTHAGWGDGSTQMGMTNIFNEDHEVCLMECIPEEDAAFICALWNAYRTGQLVPAQPSGDEDAARYRWLRDHSVPPHNFYISVPDEFHGVKYGPGEVDAYIDAARAALGEQP